MWNTFSSCRVAYNWTVQQLVLSLTQLSTTLHLDIDLKSSWSMDEYLLVIERGDETPSCYGLKCGNLTLVMCPHFSKVNFLHLGPWLNRLPDDGQISSWMNCLYSGWWGEISHPLASRWRQPKFLREHGHSHRRRGNLGERLNGPERLSTDQYLVKPKTWELSMPRG